jgi:hypothetical protein
LVCVAALTAAEFISFSSFRLILRYMLPEMESVKSRW